MNGRRAARTARVEAILRIAGVVFASAALSGCGWTHAAVLDPQGLVGLEERDLLFTAAGLMPIIAARIGIPRGRG
jgi:hypothetical protein